MLRACCLFLGDVDHKPFISSEAECRKFALDPDDEYVIVACDGLWDTISNDKAVELVYEHVKSGKPHTSKSLTCVLKCWWHFTCTLAVK